jgi:hypothetical protein
MGDGLSKLNSMRTARYAQPGTVDVLAARSVAGRSFPTRLELAQVRDRGAAGAGGAVPGVPRIWGSLERR